MWEIKKIFTNWAKTVGIFVMPAIVMVIALNLFPIIINYLSTGTIGGQKVVVVNAPQSFIDYPDKYDTAFDYHYETWSDEEVYEFLILSEDGSYYKKVSDGSLLMVFGAFSDDYKSASSDYDSAVTAFYNKLADGNEDVESNAFLFVFYNETSFTTASKYLSLDADVISKYISSLQYSLGGNYSELIEEDFTTDDYNPITYILTHRSTANYQAAKVVPGILVLLMYYCVYSLTCDMIALERRRGFLAKLKMTPVSANGILAGKMMAIVSLVSMSGIITFLFLFMSSWLNRSNDAMSLLPFGMLLTPVQMLYMIVSIPACAFLLSAFCFNVTMDLDSFDDTITNLQMPLMLFLIDFFAQMFLWGEPSAIEYFIPAHNSIVLIRDVYMSEVSIAKFIIVLIVNITIGALLFMRSCKKFREE